MPHKRAKRSIRESEKKARGFNLAPSDTSLKNDTPRSASRILNSWATQQAFRARGGKGSEDRGDRPKKKPRPSAAAGPAVSGASEAGPSNASTSNDRAAGKGKGKGKATSTSTSTHQQTPKSTSKQQDIPSILPHESLGEYNRRVESLMRGGVSKAIKAANNLKTESIRAEKQAKEDRKRKAAGLSDSVAEEEEAQGDVGKGKGKGSTKRKMGGGDGDTLEFEDRPVVTFKPKPGPRRLNDIAQAPPSLPRLRGINGVGAGAGAGGSEAGAWAGKASSGGGSKRQAGAFSALGRDPLNAGQKRLLEEERERVVKRYREMKEERERKRFEGT